MGDVESYLTDMLRMYGFVFVTSENAPLIFSARVIQKVIDCWPTDVTVSFEKRTKKKN